MTDEHHTTTDAGRPSTAPERRAADGAKRQVVSTGIDSLDRMLGGGFPVGTVIAVIANPASQSERVLGAFIDGHRVSYLTVERHPDTVHRYFDARDLAHEEVAVHRLDDTDPLADARRHLDDLDEGAVIVVDPSRSFERQPEPMYTAFLHALSEHVVASDSVAFLHCLDGYETGPGRDLTVYLADIVILLQTDTGGDRVETTLSIPKLRGGEPFVDVIKLDLTGEVDVDVTRKIA